MPDQKCPKCGKIVPCLEKHMWKQHPVDEFQKTWGEKRTQFSLGYYDDPYY